MHRKIRAPPEHPMSNEEPSGFNHDSGGGSCGLRGPIGNTKSVGARTDCWRCCCGGKPPSMCGSTTKPANSHRRWRGATQIASGRPSGASETTDAKPQQWLERVNLPTLAERCGGLSSQSATSRACRDTTTRCWRSRAMACGHCMWRPITAGPEGPTAHAFAPNVMALHCPVAPACRRRTIIAPC